MAKKRSKKTYILCSVGIVFAVLVVIIAIYLSFYYGASGVDKYMSSSNEVAVTDSDEYLFFDGDGESNVLIFYPGAQVQESAYSPIMYQLAADGIDCFVVKMPFHLAIFDTDAALDIVSSTNYENYYIGGHSLGGYAAGSLVSKNPDLFKGLILLASFCTDDISQLDIDVLSIYGSCDGVLNMNQVANCRQNMPATYQEVVISGGNHAGMGSYGNQLGDNEAQIMPQEQWRQVCEMIEVVIH